MAACKFTIPFSGNAGDLVLKAKNAVQNQGGNFEGNDSEGNFDITLFGNTVKGSYFVMGQDLNVIIDSKPFIVPCSTIESFLKSKL